MTAYEQFLASCAPGVPVPVDLSPALRALRLDRLGDWHAAHEAAREGAWVHAYLHRKEGDIQNARYWYQRAEQTESTDTLDKEWHHIAELLARR